MMILGGGATGASNQPHSGKSLLNFKSNSDLQKEQKEYEEMKAEVEETNNNPVVSSLAGHIRHSFTTAASAKTTSITQRLLKCLRQRERIYEPEIAKMISDEGGTNIYMSLTDTKANALESWLSDIMLPLGDKPYSIEPTPIPDIPPNLIKKFEMLFLNNYALQAAEVQGVHPTQVQINEEHFYEEREKFKRETLDRAREIAKEDTDYIEDHIDDELVEGGWYKQLKDFLYDFATYPTAFIEGPIFERKKVTEWAPVEGMFKNILRVKEKVVKKYVRRSPYNIYPSAGARTLQDGYLCIKIRYSRADLEKLRGVPGYDGDTINLILKEYANGYRERQDYYTEIEDLHDRHQESRDPEGHIDSIKFFGDVPGSELLQWGMSSKQITDPYRDYAVIAHMVGNYVFGAKLNPHPLGRRNIYGASFRKKNDSIWGKALPEVVRDCQNMCNSAARATANNAAIASGPQVWQYGDMIPPNEDRTDLYPWKVWTFSSENTKNAGQLPMGFWQPKMNSAELLRIYDKFEQQASEVTGIPAYIYGNEKIGGAGSTASGLSMLMNAAAKGLRNSAKNIDDGVISPSIEEHWLIFMLMNPDIARGDCKIQARASEYLIQQETLAMRRKEFMDSTNNPLDQQIMGIDGRMELLRESVKSLKMLPDKIIPPREKMISTLVEQQIQALIQKLSAALGMPPEQLIQILQAPPGQEGQSRQQQLPPPQAQDVAGNPVAGQAVRQFNQ
jgi:hypothetical protein